MAFHQDFAGAARALRQAPFMTLVLFVTLAFGLASNITIFSWLDALVYRPLTGVPDQNTLAVVDGRTAAGRDQRLSYPEVKDLRERLNGVEGIAAYTYQPFGLSVGDHAERVWGQLVTANFFDILRVQPSPGRGFRPSEENEGNGPVVVISDRLWQRRYNRAVTVLGQPVEINGQRLTIIGVAPPQFHGVAVGLMLDLWIPIGMQPSLGGGQPSRLHSREIRWLGGYARLKPDTGLSAVRDELDAIARQLAEENPGTDQQNRFTANTLSEAPWGGTTVVKPVLNILVVLTVVLALVTCASVTNVLLVRALRRRRDIALRMSLGATRYQIARQVVTESAMLAGIAGLAAGAAALFSTRLFTALLPPTGFPIGFEIGIDASWLATVVVVSILVTAVVGVAPILYAVRLPLVEVLRDDSASVTPGHKRALARHVLVGAQVGLCAALLVVSGTLASALTRASAANPGFDTERVLLAAVDLSQAGYTESRGRAFIRRLDQTLATIPGVASVSVAQRVPLDFGGRGLVTAAVEGYTPAPGETVTLSLNAVGAAYLRTMSIPLVAGREFTVDDDAGREPVAIVNERAVAMYGKDGIALDRFVRIGDIRYRVVGISRDIRLDGLTQPAPPAMLVPILQSYRPGVVVHLAARSDPAALAVSLRQRIGELDPAIAVYDVRTMGEHMLVPAFPYRLGSTLSLVFGGFALLLAVLGVYASVSQSIQERRRELGLRMAIGCTVSQLIALVSRRVVLTVTSGLAVGLGVAAVLGRLLSGLLADVFFNDVSVYAAAIAVIVCACAVAIAAPTRRLTSLSAVTVLKPSA